MNTENVQTSFLTNSKTANNLADLTLTERLETQETMRQCEAKEWIKRYRKKAMEKGQAEASAWWQRTLSDLVKKRGKAATEDLQRRMNDEIRKTNGR
jgi:broad specificity phosphatase PhoE